MTASCIDNKIARDIVRELYKALAEKGAEPELLAIVGSWGDTLDDDLILELLKSYNKGIKI